MEQLVEQYDLTAAEQTKVRFAAALACGGRSIANGQPDLEPLVQMVIAPGLAAECEAKLETTSILT